MTALYRHFDSNGVLLYVGVSLCPFTRLAAHEAVSPWASRIDKVTIQRFLFRSLALRAERLAVETEKPLFNRNLLKKTALAPREPSPLTEALPVRLSQEQTRALDMLNGKTNISRQAIIRLGLNYFLPRFISGEIDLQACIVKDRKKQAA